MSVAGYQRMVARAGEQIGRGTTEAYQAVSANTRRLAVRAVTQFLRECASAQSH
jgi:hypothetical protein